MQCTICGEDISWGSHRNQGDAARCAWIAAQAERIEAIEDWIRGRSGGYTASPRDWSIKVGDTTRIVGRGPKT